MKWERELIFARRSSLTAKSAAAAAKSLQSCLTLCDPIDGSPPGSPVPGILQARTLEWFPSPVHESEKWKWSRSVVSDPQRPHGLQPSRLLRPWDFPGKSTGVGCHCLLQQQSLELTILNLDISRTLRLISFWSTLECVWKRKKSCKGPWSVLRFKGNIIKTSTHLFLQSWNKTSTMFL